MTSAAYQQLARDLRDALSRGDFADGVQLPTETELARTTGMGRQTVRRALQELVAEGLIYRVRGRGTFATAVAPGAPLVRSFGAVDDLLALSADTTVETLEPLRRRAHVEAAGRLRLQSDEVMHGLVSRSVGGAPFCVAQIFVPLPIGALLLEHGVMVSRGKPSSRTVIDVIEHVYPPGIARAQQSITAMLAPANIATYIGCEPGDAILRIDRLYIDPAGSPVELAISYFNPDRYTYRLEMSRNPGA